MAIDKEREGLLSDAIQNDDFSTVKELIEQGLDINDKYSNGDTILHRCFAMRKYQLAQHLILLGANLFAQDQCKRTPLHISTRSGFYEGCHLYTLITKNLDSQDHNGRTALMHAIKFKQKLLIKMLMGKGSNTDLQDSNGFSALMWAVKFLDPQELKDIMAEVDDQELTEKIEQAVQDHDELQVSDEILSASKPLTDDEILSELDELPAPVSEVLNKPEVEEHIASYSITEHLESLKKKAEDDCFSYEMALKPEGRQSTAPAADGSIYNFESKKEGPVDDSLESFTRTINEDRIKDDENALDSTKIESSNNTKEEDEVTRVSSTSPELLQREEIQRVQSQAPNIINNEQLEITRPELSEAQMAEIDKVTRPERLTPVTQEESDELPERPEMEVNTIEGKKEDLAQSENWEGKGSVEKIKDEVSRVKSIEGEATPQENWVSEVKGKQEESFDYEVQKISRPELLDAAVVDKNERSQSSSPLEEKTDDTIVTQKKEITYIKDGFKEEYKDDYGEIKKVDKSINSQELGEIKQADKSIESKTEGKITVEESGMRPDRPELETLQREHIKRPDAINVEDISYREKVDEIEITRNEIERLDNPNIERPERPTREVEIIEQEAIERVKDRSAQDQPEEVISLKQERKEGASIDDDIYQFQNKPEKAEEEETIILNEKKKAAEEETTIKETTERISGDQLTPEQEAVLEQTVDVNDKNNKGQTLCWIAAQKGQTEMLKRLILKGADYEIKDTKGVSPLMIAAMNGRVDVVDYLTTKVRNIDEKRTDGQTALTLAIEHDRAEVVRCLIDNGASSDTKLKGNTLLMHAASFDSINTIKILVMLGHDPLEKNFRGKTAIDIAKTSKKKRAFKMLSVIAKSRKQGGA